MTTRGWVRFLGLRVLGTFLVLAIMSIGIFTLVYLSPGSIEKTLLGTKPVNPESIAAIRAQYHLDDSFFSQYVTWLGGVLSGDLGTSIRTGNPVGEMIGAKLPRTAALVGLSAVLATVIGVPLGILAARRRGGPLDHAVVAGSVAGMSAPPFALGLVVMLVLSVQLGWFPSYGPGEGLIDGLWHLALPALTLAIGGAGLIVRFTRVALVQQLDQDYVTFARARGLSERVVLGYALRNSLVSILTALGLVVTTTLVGTVLVEVTFAFPGLGGLLIDSVTFKDLPVVQAIALLLAILIAVINLLVDVAYTLVDPRLRLSGRKA